MKFRPDGTVLAVHGVFGARPGEMSDQESEESLKQKHRLKVWRMPSGEPIGGWDYWRSAAAIAFALDGRLLMPEPEGKSHVERPDRRGGL